MNKEKIAFFEAINSAFYTIVKKYLNDGFTIYFFEMDDKFKEKQKKHKRFVPNGTYPNFCFAKTSFMLKPVYEIAPPEMPAVLGWLKRKIYKFGITVRL